MKYLISLDSGTTSARSLVFEENGKLIKLVQKELSLLFPQPNYVEQNPLELYSALYATLIESITSLNLNADDILSISITNQRETTIVWDKKTGKPIYNAINWQDNRTKEQIEKILQDKKNTDKIKNITGLTPSSYFSATKIQWILNNVKGARKKADKNELCFGTVDTYLIYKLTNGKVFKTDYTNASRTMLFDIQELNWSKDLLNYFNIPESILPTPVASTSNFGTVSIFGKEIKITGVVGDQQAALIGQTCLHSGDVKCTYGTGCFLLLQTEHKRIKSSHGLFTTISAQTTSKKDIYYALEGSIFIGGALVQWLRDQLNFIKEASESEKLANEAKSSNGIYIVPAFSGLSAPYWDPYAKGTIFGLTRSSNKNQIVRASLESIAYQVNDLIEVFRKETNLEINKLKVDGGASKNSFLMQFQSDISNLEIISNQNQESTAFGAFFLALLANQKIKSLDEVSKFVKINKIYQPEMAEKIRLEKIKRWKKAVKMSCGWEKEE